MRRTYIFFSVCICICCIYSSSIYIEGRLTQLHAMDWSSIYDEHGDEAGSWDESHMDSRVTAVVDSFSSTRNYSPTICYMFTINYVLGVGCLGIPYAFMQSGIAVGGVLVVVVSAVALLTVLWVAEAGHIFRFIASTHKDISSFSVLLEDSSAASISERTTLASSTPSSKSARLRGMSDDSLISGGGRDHTDDFEVTDLVSAFLGPTGAGIYQVSLIVLTFIGLIAYCQVFLVTYFSQIDSSSPAFVPIALFGIIVIPLSCLDLADQVYVQVSMSVLRFVTLGALLVGVVLAIFYDKEDALHRKHSAPPFIVVDTPLYNASGVGLMISTAIFSQLFQHSVPGLIRPLATEDQKSVPKVFSYALMTTGLLYICIGAASTAYFGERVCQSINLNFVGFRWGFRDTAAVDTDLLTVVEYYAAVAFSTLIVVFPALDTLSVFPLIANTLGNNMLAAFPRWRKVVKKFVKATALEVLFPPIDKNFTYYGPLPVESKSHRATGIVGRLAAAIPPVLCCFYVRELSMTLQLAGVCGIVVALVTPALMQQQAVKFYQRFSVPAAATNNLALKPFYIDSVYSSAPFTSIVLLTAACGLVVCVSQLYNTAMSSTQSKLEG